MIDRIVVVAATVVAVLSLAASAHAHPVLSRGDAGPAVRSWQQQVNLDEVPGPDIEVDGIFGPATERKTKALQRWRGITVDGVVGPETRAAMREAFTDTSGSPEADRPLLERGMTGAAVHSWQDRLNDWLATARPEKGQLTVDGIYGPRTEAATRDLQDARDISVDGIVGPETRQALDRALNEQPDRGDA